MSKFPYNHLFPGPELTVAISGPHVQVLESKTSNIRHSTVSNDVTRQKLVGFGSIRCAAVDQAFQYLVTTTDKVLRVWQLDGLQILSEREVPKKATCIRITNDATNIIVSDKFGDIFRFPLIVSPEHCKTVSEDSSKGNPTSSPKASSSELLMGHASLLTTFILTADEKFIISADRDEHIRVSWYPEAYVIESFCLGHQKFVSALHIPPSDTARLVSGGGDPTLKIWDWMSGKLEFELDIHDAVMPYVKVKPPRRKHRSEGEDDGEDDDLSARQRRKEQKKPKKSRSNADQEEPADGELEPKTVGEREGDAMAVDFSERSAPPEEPILALHKIDSLQSTQGRLLIFSAVGATALFYCTFPSTSLPSPEIYHVNLEVPVIDFIIAPDEDIIVLLDGNWDLGDGQPSLASPRSMVRSLTLLDNQLVDRDAHRHSALLTALNSAALLNATPEVLSTLDIYTALNTLPKWLSKSQEDGTSETGDGKGKGSAPSNLKALGRMKRKQAMIAVAAGHPLQEAEAPEGGVDEAAGPSVETRDAKKPRSDAPSQGGHKMEIDSAACTSIVEGS
ncbi:WD40 repeat-like protein [Rickenella mellea]|uniref:WD40 repeat-like protein n=1 Tax=Rickenella mellea TaxID=50990 RepID=A0A4Y7Q9E0_9AGAM|nr:WD40 repeat-like protein [Rickenella mellea]